jgi:polysaccharide export outer membrane protein
MPFPGIQAEEDTVVPIESATYRISSLDVVRVSLFLADEVQFTSEGRVSQDGMLGLPYLGNVKIAGMTVEQLRDYLYEPYNRDYYVNPHIDVVVLSYSERLVTVIGKVNRQGPVPFPTEGSMYLLEAIARAGGWSNDRMAATWDVEIIRTNKDGSKYTIKVDARKITARDYPLEVGDLINVPERRI